MRQSGIIPSFETLIKNRLLAEQRFLLNNSNTKWLSIGVFPATKLLNENAPGFYFEALLCGDKSAPIPLGGLPGLNSLFATIRQIPKFSHLPNVSSSNFNQEISSNITISVGDFADDVSFLFFIILLSRLKNACPCPPLFY